MERLVTTSQAAEILGLSLQGVHYRIKKNQLKSIKQSGKTYVYIDDSNQINNNINTTNILNNKAQFTNEEKASNSEIDSIIEVKNEQIVLLKKSMKWMKKQYISEINRLEKNQKKIIEVFNSEIKLLQSAFNEMRSIYNKPQIQQPVNQDSQTNKTKEKKTFISVKEFFAYMRARNQSEQEIKYIIFRAIRNNDYRFIYNKNEKKLLILNADFEDLIK